MLRLSRFGDADGASVACAAAAATALQSAIDREGRATLAVSGGSTPKLLFRYLSRAPLDWTRVHVFWVDERPVPPDHADSNYRLAAEHLLGPANVPAANAHRIPAELPPDEAAARYRDDLIAHFKLRPGQLPRFDVIHLGMGADAHTASLFPGEPLIDDSSGIAAPVFVDKLSQWRITLLPGVLLTATNVLVLTAGSDKAEALRSVAKADHQPLTFPAQLLSKRNSPAQWFVDDAAARLLEPAE